MEPLIGYLRDALKRIKVAAINGGNCEEYEPLLGDGENTPHLDEESADNGNENEFEFEIEHRHVQEREQPELKGLDVLKCIAWSKAAREGSISDLKELLGRCPESAVGDTTPATQETLLHLAVRHGHCDVGRSLVEKLRLANWYHDVVNLKDGGGDTVLHLATYRKQLQTLELLLEYSPGMVEVNKKNNGGFTALDMLDVPPEKDEVDLEIRKLVGKAGAMRSKHIVEQKADSKNHEIHLELGKPLPRQPAKSESPTRRYRGLLLTATLIATITFHAALRYPETNTFPIENQDSEINHLFILFNSFAFFTSVTLITLLTYGLPLKPWLLIVVFAAIGAYMCIIMAISPHEVVTVLYIGSFISLVAFFRCLGMDRTVVDYMQWMLSRIHVT